MKLKTFFLTVGFLLALNSAALAANTEVRLGVAKGESDTTAYSLSVLQRYEPLVAGTLGELAPTAELAAHFWDGDGDDNVWGGSIAPGLRFTMFTDGSFNPYLGASVGAAALSDDTISNRDLGSHVLFKSQGVVGVEFGESNRHRIQGEYNYFSNWGISNTNDGYSTVGASYSFSF